MSIDLTPIYRFFEAVGLTPWPFQVETWMAYAEGQSGLINVPTGSGKTYAAYGGSLAHLIQEPKKGLQILYISPLRATTHDLYKSLMIPIKKLDLPFEVGMRTGDTTQSIRLKQKKMPPEIILTTPESLAVMLSDKTMHNAFDNLKVVIVDEWHELLGNKRGVMLELLLSQLAQRASFRLWGMSATVGNKEESAQVLGGAHHDLIHVSVDLPREVMISTILPPHFSQLPWSGFFGMKMLPHVLKELDLSKSTLLFTNTRVQAEKWYHGILSEYPEWKNKIAIHHASIDLQERKRVEELMKNGELRLTICTSSLDLGIDFPQVEKVIQIGSTKNTARLIQRAGRSNHRPFEPCHVQLVPTHALELMELMSLRKGVEDKILETKNPLKKCWDVLIQHMISRAITEGFTKEEILKEISETYAYANITEYELNWLLNFLEKGGESLIAYPEFHKLKLKEGRYYIEDRKIIQLHRLNIGTIPSSNVLLLKYLSGRKIGWVEESFINRLKTHETFMFGGKTYELLMSNQSEVIVKLSKKPTKTVAQWVGTRLPLSSNLSELVRSTLKAPSLFQKYPEYQMFKDVLNLQKSVSEIPTEDQLLVEITHTREGWHLFYYTFESRLIHQTLNALVAFRLLRFMKSSFTLACSDYGCEILSSEPFKNIENIFMELFTEENLVNDLHQAVNLSEMAKSAFRDIARIAGLVIQGFPNKRKPLRHIQMSTSLLYEVFSKYDPDNLLLQQAKNEVMQRDIDLIRLKDLLSRVRSSQVRFVFLKKLSPFALPIYVEAESTHLSNESLEEMMVKIQQSWLKR